MTEPRPLRLFISYAHDDDGYRRDLEDHLIPLKRQKVLETWSDRAIEAGQEWEKSISKQLQNSDIILLLISRSFLASEFIYEKELMQAMIRHETGQARVIPVFLRPCYWKGEIFGKLQGVPDDAKPISKWDDYDEAVACVAEAIAKAAEGLIKERTRRETEERERREREEKARHEAEERARQEQEERAQREAEERARHEAKASNAMRKEALVQRAETLAGSTNWKETREALDGLKEEWKEIGSVGDEVDELLRAKFQTALQKFFSRYDEHEEAVKRSVDLPVFRDVDAPWCPEMVGLPAGTFLMGSLEDEEGRSSDEGPQHRVIIGYRLAIGRYPVMFDEYDHFCAETKREKPEDANWGRGRRPVINISWRDAQAYIDWLAKKTSQPYRLPSEAEWEYACRAGTTTPFSFGATISTGQANYNGNYTYGKGRRGKYRERTTEVGSFPPNPWGLYDMHGNVWEWVEDVWHESYEGAPADGSAWTDDQGKKSAHFRVYRGGSWNNTSRGLRSAFRFRDGPAYRYINLGFRVVRRWSIS